MPIIEQDVKAYASFGTLKLHLNLIQFKPDNSHQGVSVSTMTLPEYSAKSINSLSLALVPQPMLISVYPQNVFNLVDLKTIQVYGEEFSDFTVCVFDTTTGPSKRVVVRPEQVVDNG